MTTASVIGQLESLFAGGSVAGMTDRELIESFNAGRGATGEAAFTAIVNRHGPMVLDLCLRWLADPHDAEDAFQAVFLVLARKARSIGDPGLLANWLYGVAIRVARNARTQRDRRRKKEEAAMTPNLRLDSAVSLDHSDPTPEQTAFAREQAEILYGEIERLPQPFRAAVVLCYFEGLTLDQAARRLRCPAGTVRSRLARAYDKLRRGLTRRGVVIPAAGIAAALASKSAAACVPSVVCESTARAAMNFSVHRAVVVGAMSASAFALARGVLRSMLIAKLRLGALSLLVLGVIAGGAGYMTQPLSALAGPWEDEPPSELRPNPARTEPRPPEIAQEANKPALGRMFVVGRVLDSAGKPVPNASVMVYGSPFQGGEPAALGRAKCDGSGQFRLEMSRTSAATHQRVSTAALASGYGVGWVDLDVAAEFPAAEITLRAEQFIEGRLFDINGQVAQGVQISVEGMGYPPRGPDALPDGVEGGPYFWGQIEAKSLTAWPAPVTSGPDGRFTIRGVRGELRVALLAEHARFARQRIVVDTGSAGKTKPISAAMQPAKVIIGHVTYADTGEPVPRAAISITAYRGGPGYSSDYETDIQGNFRANPFSTDSYAVSARAPAREPYLSIGTGPFEWPKGALEHRVDLVLPRGVTLRGRVVEEGSRLPVDGAAIGFVSRGGRVGGSARRAWTGRDGTYELAVPPTPGTIVVLGPSDDYIFQEMGQKMLLEGRPGGHRVYSHAFVSCDLKPGTKSSDVDVVLRRGATVKARVTGPDGHTVANAWMFSRLLLLPQPWETRIFWGEFHGNVRNGQCELHGLARDSEVPVYFLDSKNQLGAVARFSAQTAAAGPSSVRLEPCGRAMGRLVDPKGTPLAGYRDPYLISMIVTPGRDRHRMTATNQDELSADGDYLSEIDPDHFADLVSDSQGRVTFTALIPGAIYRIHDTNEGGDSRLRKEFAVKSGEKLELGDILIEKPEP